MVDLMILVGGLRVFVAGRQNSFIDLKVMFVSEKIDFYKTCN